MLGLGRQFSPVIAEVTEEVFVGYMYFLPYGPKSVLHLIMT